MGDQGMVKIMETLGLNYNPAINATKAFENRIASLNKQLLEMKALAMQGAKDINTTFSSTLGTMGGNKTILDQFGQPLKTIQAEAPKASSTIKKMAAAYADTSNAAKQYGETIKDTSKEFNIAADQWSRRSQWFISGTVFYGSIKAAKEAVQSISEVEMGMVEIARVMEDGTFRFNAYRDQLLQLGVDYGQSFEVVQDIALRWAQAGYGVRDSLENTKNSLLALNTAELDAKNATESLIGIMAQWKMTSDDLPLLLDKINKTADDFTLTSQDLVDGLLRSSGAARIMNLSIDETIGLLTVMREASGRTGQEVGNALNSILSYVQRPSSIKMLESMGIKMFADEARTQFRNVMEVFKDVAAKWNTASDQIKDGFVQSADDAGLFSEELSNALGLQEEWNNLQQRDIAQASAGVYRRNYYIGMIERLSGAQEVLNGLTNAAGYSQAENAKTMDTLEKKYESLKTSAVQLAVALGDAGLLDTLKNIVDAGTDAAGAISKLNPEMKALLTTALEIIAISAALKGVMGLFTAKNLFTAGTAGAALLPGWTKLLVIIPAVIGGLALLSKNYNAVADGVIELKRRQDELVRSYNSQIEAAEKSETGLLGEAKAAEALADKLEELTRKENLNTSEKAQMKAIVDQLNSVMPNLNLQIDQQTGKIDGNTAAIRNNIQALKDQAVAQAWQSKAAAAGIAYVEQELLLGEAQSDLDAAKARLSDLRKNPALSEIEALRKAADEQGFSREGLGRAIAKINAKYGVANIEQQINDARKEVQDYALLVREQNASLMKIDAELKGYTEKVSETGSSGAGTPSPSPGDELVIIYKGKEIKYVKQSEVAKYLQQGWSTTPPPSGGSTGTYSNPALDNALRVLDHKKHINQLSIEDEIATLKIIQSKYVKTTDERMNLTERIYDAEQALIKENEKAQKDSLERQEKTRKKFMDFYRETLKEIQDEIKDAYDERIDLIDQEIDKIDEQIEAIKRSEDARSHDKTISDLKDERDYWSVRTSEDARKKVKEINEKIAEEEHKREIELEKQGLEDKKDVLEDEKKQWKSALDEMLKAFEKNNLDIVAGARINSMAAYDEWYSNYILPMQNALQGGNLSDFQSRVGQVGGSISKLPSHDWGMTDADYRKFVANGNRWFELKAAGASQSELDKLNTENDALRRKYGRDPELGEYPSFGGGGKALTDGFGYLHKEEIVLPPNLSSIFERFVDNTRRGDYSYTNSPSYDNRRETKIDKVLHIEHFHNEDNTDSEILARQLGRELQKA